MSNFSNRDSQSSPVSATPVQPRQESFKYEPPRQEFSQDSSKASGSSTHPYNVNGSSPQPRAQRERAPSRPMSMVQAYQPPLMDVSQDTLPELQPIFTFLNSHGNKLYQEGYFLKLDDQNTRKHLLLFSWAQSLISLRWQSKCRPDLDRMLRTASRNCSFAVGRRRTRCRRPRWGGSPQIHQFDRRIN